MTGVVKRLMWQKDDVAINDWCSHKRWMWQKLMWKNAVVAKKKLVWLKMTDFEQNSHSLDHSALGGYAQFVKGCTVKN